MYLRAAILLLAFSGSKAFVDPLTLGFAAFVASGSAGTAYYFMHCKFYECCSTENGWLKNDFVGLAQDLDKYLYGQHLVRHSILKLLEHHYQNENPTKALVLSLHGPTGTGKNYVTNMIARRMYKEGMDSKYVKLWIGKHDFKHKSEEWKYAAEIKKVIKEKVSACPRSLFIIDEMDHVTPGVIDTLKPYLDFHEKVDGVDYRKATFIFVSNTGAENITALTFNYKYNKLKRGDIGMKDVRQLIENGAFNEGGGLWRAAIIKNNLIDVYVPFLPLEREHVISCITFYLEEKSCTYTSNDIENIIEQMTFTPKNYNYFCKNGCKLLESTIVQTYNNKCLRNKVKRK